MGRLGEICLSRIRMGRSLSELIEAEEDGPAVSELLEAEEDGPAVSELLETDEDGPRKLGFLTI